MPLKPRLLDLFCGAGGVAKGYQRAGFEVWGVDNQPQPRYCGEEFIKADALMYLKNLIDTESDGIINPDAANACGTLLSGFDAIHASPPCQGYSRMRHLPWLKGREYPMLIDKTRELLEKTILPWVIENVEDAHKHMKGAVMLCGTMFGLKVYRHRLFLSNQWLWQPSHPRHKHVIGSGRMLNDRAGASEDGWVSLPSKGTALNGLRSDRQHMTVAGHFGGMELAKTAMGINWMNRAELAQAIPPAYTEHIGKALMGIIQGRQS